ncbi:MAG: hypothetical protein J6R66_02030 [Clostridia bacterium]|nr:hypothetical protein [Clostridia bacterium]
MEKIIGITQQVEMTPDRVNEYNKITASLQEFEGQAPKLSFRDALIYMRKRYGAPCDPRDRALKFGTCGFFAADYDVLTAVKLEEVRKYLNLCKKTFRGMKIYVQVFASTNYWNKESVAMLDPGEAMWEFEGITYQTAESIAYEVSKIIHAPIKVVGV